MTELVFLTWRRLTRNERVCLLALQATIVAWTRLPATPQDQAYHAFADQRTSIGISRAANVLSNLEFIAVGLAGAVGLAPLRRRAGPTGG